MHFYLCTVITTMLDNPLHFLMNQLHTAQARFFQTFDLPFYQQLKGNFRNKQGRTGTLVKKGGKAAELCIKQDAFLRISI